MPYNEAYPSLWALLQARFQGHTVIEEDGQYYLDEKAEKNRIFLPNRATFLMRCLYNQAYYLYEMFRSLGPDPASSPVKLNARMSRVSRENLATLHRLAGPEFQYFAPPFYHCPQCGYMEGSPSYGHEDTIGQQPLSGHRGSVLLCKVCGKSLGSAPDGLHTYALAEG